MRRLMIATVVMMFMGGCLLNGGCSSKFGNSGKIGMKVGWSFEIYQDSPNESFESEVNLLPEVWERIKKDAEEVVDADRSNGN
ncbi:MAG: hypothetical protein V3V96_14290 [Acidiferrobacterales bacterium]